MPSSKNLSFKNSVRLQMPKIIQMHIQFNMCNILNQRTNGPENVHLRYILLAHNPESTLGIEHTNNLLAISAMLIF